MARLKFEIVRNWRGDYSWRLVSTAGQVLAVAGHSYPTADAVRRDVRGMQPGLASAAIEMARRAA